MQNYITTYLEHDEISVKIDVAVTETFKTTVGTNLENFGSIEIQSIFKGNDEKVFWDNLNFFLNAPMKEIKKDCKEELLNKRLFYKGILKEISDRCKYLADLGYLKAGKIGEKY